MASVRQDPTVLRFAIRLYQLSTVFLLFFFLNKLSLEERFQIIRSVGEECIHEDEL
ncbi:hypothetical protein COLO4_16092 [Corchorus olitorius]|uniref:Uncharacterized protein n=1 Tax=Corchorus olitorius TaxID=93759 RepID=A0A1R3JJN5_9ROSI|nr:hypothetical protein COLO4_16092 [Corchorus olitorius]